MKNSMERKYASNGYNAKNGKKNVDKATEAKASTAAMAVPAGTCHQRQQCQWWEGQRSHQQLGGTAATAEMTAMAKKALLGMYLGCHGWSLRCHGWSLMMSPEISMMSPEKSFMTKRVAPRTDMGHTWQKILCPVAVAEWPIAIMSLIISLNHYTVSIGQSTPINSRLGIIFTMPLSADCFYQHHGVK